MVFTIMESTPVMIAFGGMDSYITSQKSWNEDETDQFIEIEDRYFIAAHLCHLLSGLGEWGGGWGQERVVGFLLSSSLTCWEQIM